MTRNLIYTLTSALPNQVPQQKQKSKFVTIEKNINSTFKRTPHRPTRPSKHLPTGAPPSTPLSSRGFLTLPSSRATTITTRGAEAESKNKEGPPKAPRRRQRPQPNPLFMPPHPQPSRTRSPFLLGTAGAPGLSLARRRAVPFPPSPRRSGIPTTEQLGRS